MDPNSDPLGAELSSLLPIKSLKPREKRKLQEGSAGLATSILLGPECGHPTCLFLRWAWASEQPGMACDAKAPRLWLASGSPGTNLLGSPTSGNQLQWESPTELLQQANQSNLWVVVVEWPLLFGVHSIFTVKWVWV